MSLKKHTLLIGFSSVLHTGLGFLSGILLTRMLGAEGRGVLSKVEASVALLSVLATMKVQSGIVYFIANRQVDPRRVLGISLIALTAGALLTAIVTLLFLWCGWGGLLLPATHTSAFFAIYLIVLFVFRQIQLSASAFLRGIRNFSEVYASTVALAVFRLAFFALMFGVAWLIGREYSVREGMLLHLTVIIVGMAISLYYFFKNFGFRPSFEISWSNDWSPFWAFTTANFLALFGQFLNRKLDVWFVEGFAGVSALGVYALAATVGELLLLFPNTMREVMLPYFASGERDDNIANLQFFSRVNLTLSIIILGGLCAVADPLLPWIYGAEFADAVTPFRILSIGIAFTAFGTLFVTFNNAHGFPRFNVYANFAALAVTIALDILLIPRYGIIGAAAASTLAYIVSALFACYSVFVLQRVPLGNYFLVQPSDVRLGINYLRRRLSRARDTKLASTSASPVAPPTTKSSS